MNSLLLLLLPALGQMAETRPDEIPRDIVARQQVQVQDYFLARIAETPQLREKTWRIPVEQRRARLAQMIGLEPLPAGRIGIRAFSEHLELWSRPMVRALAFFPGKARQAAIIAVPPEDQPGAAYATRSRWVQDMLERGVAVIIPQLPERLPDHPLSKQFRGKDRRHILHRLGWVTGRSVIGLDAAQLMAIVSAAAADPRVDPTRIGISGGMAALYTAALDPRIRAAAITGYFGNRSEAWREPVDRMIHGQLVEFGDAEVAALVAPRQLVLAGSGFDGELARARRLSPGIRTSAEAPEMAVARLLGAGAAGAAGFDIPDAAIDRDQHFEELLDHLRARIQASEAIREKHWSLAARGPAQAGPLRAELRRLVGAVTEPRLKLAPRIRKIGETDAFRGYEVLLPVIDGIDAWGHLLIPKNAARGGPAVITQHGLGGQPKDLTLLGPEPNSAYHGYAARLAEQGYVVFAPYVAHPIPQAELINPLVRQAALAGKMRISAELARLGRIVDFLESLEWVARDNIHYYGLSYGGYSAIWMGPLEPRLKSVIVSGHFNDWRTKITNEEKTTSYLLHPDEDFYNWDVLHRFTHVELIAAMWPRPVCVEFAHRDGTTFPEWHERAWNQVQAWVKAWGGEERVVRDHFDGIHEIHGAGTFDFLRRWARPELGAGRDWNPLVTRRLRVGERVRGVFYLAPGNPEFRGIAIRASGPVAVSFEGIGEAAVSGDGDWLEAPVPPRRLKPGVSYWFEVRALGDVELRGPAPLGGERFAEDFAVSFRLR